MGFSLIFLLCVILIGLLDGGHAYGYCPPAFEQHGYQCYKVIDLQLSWLDAKEYCAIIGDDLARITSASDHAIISGLRGIDPKDYWLDGSDFLVKKEWRWMGRKGASVPFSYTNWSPAEPNLDDEHCLEIRYSYDSKWNNLNCDALRRFICQARATFNRGDTIRSTNRDVLKHKEELYL